MREVNGHRGQKPRPRAVTIHHGLIVVFAGPLCFHIFLFFYFWMAPHDRGSGDLAVVVNFLFIFSVLLSLSFFFRKTKKIVKIKGEERKKKNLGYFPRSALSRSRD